MSANAFRSPLMQQIANAARNQHRPPFAFSSSQLRNEKQEKPSSPSRSMNTSSLLRRPSQTKTIHDSARSPLDSLAKPILTNIISPFSTNNIPLVSSMKGDEDEDPSSHFNLQSTIHSRRTTSAYKPFDVSKIPELKSSIARAISCATRAPNHHRTEPTTYYRIVTNTKACEKLMDICYNVALCRNLKKRTREEAEKNAEAKKKKWQETIGAYIVVCVANQPVQDELLPYKDFETKKDEDFEYWYDTLPMKPPQTERQLEDYASACASIQNMLLSLHTEELGSKWATGPMIRCRATRSLIGCEIDEAIAGLIMVGDAKIIPKEWRRRRAFEGDVFRKL